MRCLALAEEFTGRGARVLLLGDVGDVTWVRDQLPATIHRGASTPATLLDQAGNLALDVVVLDSYLLDPDCAGVLRDAGVVTMAIVDADIRRQKADLYLDQNLGAESPPMAVPDGARWLAGLDYALIRDRIRVLRPAAPRQPWPGAPRVLCVFGGTDPYRGAPVLTRLLLATRVAVSATVVCADPRLVELSRLAVAGSTLVVVPPTSSLPELMASADLVISAAGTSTWELACLGVATALVWVADNQRPGYAQATSHRLAAGLGQLEALRDPDGTAARAAVGVLRNLLTEPALRSRLAVAAFGAVDGLGRARVVDQVMACLAARHGEPPARSSADRGGQRGGHQQPHHKRADRGHQHQQHLDPVGSVRAHDLEVGQDTDGADHPSDQPAQPGQQQRDQGQQP
jgi:spore coat polysaccharide biosynthesis predicted glycosyltransferase SpsG